MAAETPRRPGGWRWLPAASVFVVIVAASAVGAWWARGHLVAPPSTPAATGKEAPDERELLKRGRLLYQVSCVNCHGPEGRGDGPSSLTMKPPPRDFAEGPWKFGSTPAAVRKVIRDGIPGTAMPSSPALNEADLDALTAFVLTMAPRSPSAARLPADVQERLRAAGFSPVDPPREAPPLDLLDLDGKPMTLAQHRGQAVLVNFWGTDCVPCLTEMPELERLAEALSPRDGQPGLVVLAVCLDETDREAVRKVARQHAQRLPVFVDPRGLGKLRYDVQILPSTFLIDSQGRLVGMAEGKHAWSGQEWKAIIPTLSR